MWHRFLILIWLPVSLDLHVQPPLQWIAVLLPGAMQQSPQVNTMRWVLARGWCCSETNTLSCQDRCGSQPSCDRPHSPAGAAPLPLLGILNMQCDPACLMTAQWQQQQLLLRWHHHGNYLPAVFYCLSLNPEQSTEIWDTPRRPTALLCPYTGFDMVYL